MIEMDLFAFLGIVVAAYISPRFALSEGYETEMCDQEILGRIRLAIPACREETSIAVWNLLGALVLVLGKTPLAIPKSRDDNWRGS